MTAAHLPNGVQVVEISEGHPYFERRKKRCSTVWRAINQVVGNVEKVQKRYFRHQDFVTVVCHNRHNKTYHSSGVLL